MAREVEHKLEEILAKAKGASPSEGAKELKLLKDRNRVSAVLTTHCFSAVMCLTFAFFLQILASPRCEYPAASHVYTHSIY